MRSAVFGVSLLAVLVSVWAADAYDDGDSTHQVLNLHAHITKFLEGDTFTEMFVLPSASAQVIITVETAKDSYIEGENIIISGRVNPVLDNTPIFLSILLNGEIKEILQITPAQDGTYIGRVVASGPNWRTDGEYTIRAYYGEGNNVETTLQFVAERLSTTDIWVVDVGSSGTIDVYYTISGGEITDMEIDPEQISLFTTLTTTRDGFVTMDMERRLIDATEGGSDSGFIVLIDGTQVPHTELTSDRYTREIKIRFNEGDTNIQIIGTETIPRSVLGIKMNPEPLIVPVTDTAAGSMLEAYMSRGLVAFAGSPAPGLDAARGNVHAGFLLAGILVNGAYTDLSEAGIADWDDITVFLRETGNVPPVLLPVGDYTINARDALTFRVSAMDFDDTVSYTLSGAPGGAAMSGQGEFSWTPGPADEGDHTFTIIAYDVHGAADAEYVTVTVLPAGTPNRPPTAPNVTTTVTPNSRVTVVPALSDPDGDRLSITNATGDTRGAVMSSDGRIEYTIAPNATTETITYTVQDSRGATSTGTVTAVITASDGSESSPATVIITAPDRPQSSPATVIITAPDRPQSSRMSPIVYNTILPDASFILIPSEPNVGATVRVIGKGFGINNNLALFIDRAKLEAFQSDQNGEFIITTTIPSSASADRVNFIVRDNKGGEKTVSLRLGQPASRIPPSEAELTVDGLPSIIYRGDTLTLSGTAEPGSTVTALVTTPSDVIIRANSTQVGSDGKWSEEYTVPVNAELGTYVAEITDDQSSIIREFTVGTSDPIQITPVRLQFEPGDLIVFNGTAAPNQPLEWTLEDPKGIDIHSESIDVGADGQVSISFQTELSNIKGTYILFAIQGEHTGISPVGLGQSPDELIIATMDRLNYNAGDEAVITIEGPPLSSISLIVISPTGQNMSADTIEVDDEGRAEYVLDLTGYNEGIYTVGLTKGHRQTIVEFGVGLKNSTNFIDLNIAKAEYMRSDALMIHGATLQNLQNGSIKARPGPHVLLTIYVIDPAGNTFRKIDTFSDGSGLFVESVRIPADAEYGRWTVSVRSDKGLPAECQQFSSRCDVILKDTMFNVIPVSGERGMVIIVEEVGKEIVSIRVVGVGPDLRVSIVSPFGEVLESIEPYGSDGEAHIPWLVPSEFIPGQYTIRATDIYGNATGTFELSDFT